MAEETIIKAFKGFNPDMRCRDFQYKEGEQYETTEARCCDTGFHACEYPLDCFKYYGPRDSVYHAVELSGETDRDDDDTKIAATKIKIGARLSIAGLVEAAIDYVKSHCTNKHNADPGEPATAGSSGAATAGSYGAATAGYTGAATAGSYGAATAGDSGAATAGSYGAATSRGSVSVGANGIGCVRGECVKIRGGLGAILLIAVENDNDYDIKAWKAIRIDGKKYKPDTWYTINDDGKVVEVPEG